MYPPTQPSPTRVEGSPDNPRSPCGTTFAMAWGATEEGSPGNPLPPCKGGLGWGVSAANPDCGDVLGTTLQGADAGSWNGSVTSGGVTSFSRTSSHRL